MPLSSITTAAISVSFSKRHHEDEHLSVSAGVRFLSVQFSSISSRADTMFPSGSGGDSTFTRGLEAKSRTVCSRTGRRDCAGTEGAFAHGMRRTAGDSRRSHGLTCSERCTYWRATQPIASLDCLVRSIIRRPGFLEAGACPGHDRGNARGALSAHGPPVLRGSPVRPGQRASGAAEPEKPPEIDDGAGD
jgi:hypothetical protein